jgi:hypothetical protein
METRNSSEPRYSKTYKIDYGRVDVARIMDQIQDKVSRQPASAPAEACGLEPEMLPAGLPPQGPLTLKKKVKNKLHKLLAPFFPVMKLIALPVQEELELTNEKLFQASRRIDELTARLNERDITKEYIKLLHVMCHNLVLELTKLRVEHDSLKSKVQVLEKDFEFLGKREKILEQRLVR